AAAFQARGAPGFVAPERARGARADRASDVWSLAATCFACLSGGPPFPPEAASGARPPRLPIDEVRDERAMGVLSVVERALAWSPAARPEAIEMARWLLDAAEAAGLECPLDPDPVN